MKEVFHKELVWGTCYERRRNVRHDNQITGKLCDLTIIYKKTHVLTSNKKVKT